MSKRPFILVNHRSPLANSGKPSGISTYMLSVTRALINRGHFDVGLVTSWRKEDLPSDVIGRLRSFVQQPLVRPRIVDVFKQAVIMPRLARRLGADIILNVDPIGTPAGGGVLFTVIHDVYHKKIPHAFSRREKFLSDLILRLILYGSDAAICVSETTKSDLGRFYPFARDKALRIYGDAGAVLHRTHPESTKPENRYALWVGKITVNKNVECFYQALRLLADMGESINAVIVGDDLYGYAERAELKYGKGLNVRRLGMVSIAELQELFQGALCFVNTSIYEGFGMPVIEAQRLGIPVVCSTGGALAEIAGVGALTFRPDDPNILAEHLLLLNANKALREEMVALGYENASRFSWDRTAEEIEVLAHKLLPA